MKKILITILVVITAGALFIFAWSKFATKSPYEIALQGNDTQTETIVVEVEDVAKDVTKTVDQPAKKDKKEIQATKTSNTITKEIMVTNGVRHSVPLKEIVGGGPKKDGIPSIDDPKFVSSDKADDYLDNEEVGIALSLGDVDRFYSFKILVLHEIVNELTLL